MKIENVFLYLLNFLLYWISKFIKKDKSIWVFGAWMGNKYADNSRFLFEYVSKFHPEIRAIWITNNKEIIKRIRDNGGEAYKKYDIKAVYLSLKAVCSIFVHSNSLDNLPFLNNGKTKLVQLWHGIPLKKIGFDDDKYSTRKESIIKEKVKSIFFPFLKENYDVVIASSLEDKMKFKSAFLSKDIIVTGYPRNDILINTGLGNHSKTIVTYFPTFRDNIGDEIDLFSEYQFDVDRWEDSLSKNNISFKIKLHPANKPKKEILDKLSVMKSLSFLDDEEDATEFLSRTDILVTDYSSVYFDFLLTGKPVIFSPFDYDSYLLKDRELYYDYNSTTPGPKCSNWNEVLDWILKFKESDSYYDSNRIEVKNKFHMFSDGNNSSRVYHCIHSLVNGKNYEKD